LWILGQSEEFDLMTLELLEVDVVYSCEAELERWQLVDGIEAESGDYVGD
jgi:hypothetical protein